jgi:hypothetical protein
VVRSDISGSQLYLKTKLKFIVISESGLSNAITVVKPSECQNDTQNIPRVVLHLVQECRAQFLF